MGMKAKRGVRMTGGKVDLPFFTIVPRDKEPGQNVPPWIRHTKGREVITRPAGMR